MKLFVTVILSLSIIISISLPGCTRKPFMADTSGRPKNVILIIGDGMGLAHVYAAMSLSKRDLNISKSTNIGFSRTHSYDKYSTDSGAGGTALATGVKTRNGMVGMRPDSTNATSLIELAHRKGLAGGVVSTSSVTHATPATFVAHCINRNYFEEIATYYLKTKPEVFIGGGYDNFAKRRDSVNLIDDLKKEGYQVVLTLEDLLDADTDKLAALLAPVHLPSITEGRGDMLAYSSIKAIETLIKNEQGFFLMIEASQIDWGAHENNTQYLVEEVIDLDRTLGVVLDFAENNGETLVVVTADHETGGMTLTNGDIRKLSVTAAYSTTGHTGVAVPVFAFGPGANLFAGFYQNTEIFDKIKMLLKL